LEPFISVAIGGTGAIIFLDRLGKQSPLLLLIGRFICGVAFLGRSETHRLLLGDESSKDFVA